MKLNFCITFRHFMHKSSPIVIAAETLMLLLSMCFEYLVFTGIFYFIFYVWKKKKFWYYKIQQFYSENKHIFRDIRYSFSTIIIFGLVIVPVMWASSKGLTRIYHPLDKFGYGYYVFSILLMVAVHDTYFYWIHRFLHWKPMFKYVHRIHHLSHNPTPFSAYAFHPVEALLMVGIIPLVAFTIPHHGTAITIFTLYQLFVNVLGHLGHEFFPRNFMNRKVLKWHNAATHHNMHHRYIKCNYGLYFNFWDWIMKTNHPRYEEIFAKVVAQRLSAGAAVAGEAALPAIENSLVSEERL